MLTEPVIKTLVSSLLSTVNDRVPSLAYERLQDGECAAPLGPWTYAAGWTIDGEANTIGASAGILQQELATTLLSGSSYNFSFDITDAGAGPVVSIQLIAENGATVVDTIYSAAAALGTKTSSGTVSGDVHYFRVSTVASAASFDNFSLIA